MLFPHYVKWISDVEPCGKQPKKLLHYLHSLSRALLHPSIPITRIIKLRAALERISLALFLILKIKCKLEVISHVHCQWFYANDVSIKYRDCNFT